MLKRLLQFSTDAERTRELGTTMRRTFDIWNTIVFAVCFRILASAIVSIACQLRQSWRILRKLSKAYAARTRAWKIKKRGGWPRNEFFHQVQKTTSNNNYRKPGELQSSENACRNRAQFVTWKRKKIKLVPNNFLCQWKSNLENTTHFKGFSGTCRKSCQWTYI